MLYLYTSNQLEQLAALFAKITETPLKDVFGKEMVVVQNSGMARWLSMQTADYAGICANFEYLFPAEFMWKLLRIVTPDISEQSQCTPETLCFHIMQELTENHADYPELAHYIYQQTDAQESNNPENRLDQIASWDLSCQLAQVLDQYLFFRSDWIQQWEEYPEKYIEDDWQARLWVRCVKQKGLIHWKTLQDQFKQSVQTLEKADFPERVLFFSMSALSPGYIELLGELAQFSDIYLFLINPCEDIYWGDIVSQKTRARLSAEEQDYVEVGNPLLASMGKQGRDFIHQFLEIPAAEHYSGLFADLAESDQEAANNSVLAQLQSDIYHLKEPRKIVAYDFAADHSIRVNACHTAMREVEVLYDQILDALDRDDTLTPAEIVVMMPDIDHYAPYIEAVFSSSEVQIPYSIADRNPLEAQQLVEVLLKTLKLVESRFDVESVFEILDYSAVRSRFNLDETGVDKCRKVALASNIRWGIDRRYRRKNRLPDTPEHTWKYALDSLLLGYTLGEGDYPQQLFCSDSHNQNDLPLLPYNLLEGSEALLLADLKHFTEVIFSIAEWLDEAHSVHDWLDKTTSLIKQLFDENSDLPVLLNALDHIRQTAELAQFEQTVSFAVFFKLLQSGLSEISASEKFLGHGITFCAMVPMRSIPFKVIALMGMNDAEFPRQNKRQSFDRLTDQKRRGDRSKRDEDRYLFLECLLAARTRLIISYIGQSVKDNTEMPPSILVSELLDTLVCYSGIAAEEWITKHPLQAFSPRYFNQGNQQKALFSYAREYTQLDKSVEAPSQVFIESRLQELDESFRQVNLDQFIQFYKSPARAFLKQRFAIQTFDDDITLPIREPFELEAFKDTELRQLILQSQDSADDERLNPRLLARAKGLLPYGEIGDNIFRHEQQLMQGFSAKLPEIDYLEKQSFSLSLDEFTLYGELDRLANNPQSAGIARTLVKVSQAYYTDYIELWLKHLVLNCILNTTDKENAVESNKYTYFYSPEESFYLQGVSNPQETLSQLLHYYWEGLHFPLKFFPKSALSLFSKKGEKVQINTRQAVTSWHGNNQRAGEKDKFEHWLVYRTLEMSEQNLPEEFLHSSQLIFGNMLEHRHDLSA